MNDPLTDGARAVPNPPAPAASLGWAWVPIRSLAARHRPRIHGHLVSLDARDRYLRFGWAATDEQVSRYVDEIDFDRDELFGIHDRRLQLVALAHVAYTPAPQGEVQVAEFGVSVLPAVRRRGFGRRLFDLACLHARNRGVQMLYIHALSENAAMLHIARAAGATLDRAGSEAEAWLKLPPDTIATRFSEVLEGHVAEIDYQWKAQMHRMCDIIEGIGEVRDALANRPKLGS